MSSGVQYNFIAVKIDENRVLGHFGLFKSSFPWATLNYTNFILLGSAFLLTTIEAALAGL